MRKGVHGRHPHSGVLFFCSYVQNGMADKIGYHVREKGVGNKGGKLHVYNQSKRDDSHPRSKPLQDVFTELDTGDGGTGTTRQQERY